MAFESNARWAACALLACAASLVGERDLHAEPSDAQKETARSLMAEGRQLRHNADLHGALTRFQAADAIMRVPTTGLEVAKAQADLELLVEARSTIRGVRALPVKEDDPEPFREAREKAEALDAELNARIGSLHFVVTGLPRGSNAVISVDGDALPEAAVSMPFRLNPGHHRIVAKYQRAQAVCDVEIQERETLGVPLTFHLAKVRDPPAPAAPPAEPLPTLAYVAGGVGIAGLLVGGVSGELALSKKHAADAGCTKGQCPPSTWHDMDSARSLATVSTVSFIVGAVGLGVGVFSLLSAGRAPEPPVQASFVVLPGAGSLNLSGRF